MDEKSTGSSYIDTGMRDFQERVKAIEVLDVNSTVLRFTWNQKPKGNGGILKKNDCIMANLEFNMSFVGAIISAISNLRSFLGFSGFCMFKVVKHLKMLKKPLYANTAYFHKVVKSEATRNRIDFVTTTNGVSVDSDWVPLAFIDHYAEFLGQKGVTSNFNIIDLFCKQLSCDVANHMIHEVSNQEIRKAMFVIGDNKARVRIGTPRCTFQVDIQKAYDTVDWNFLHAMLIGFGCHPRMIGWIMECVIFTSFSLSINGSFHRYFKGERGLRQGDPMSLYPFTLVMEVHTLMLHRKAWVSGSFIYHMYCSKQNLINLYFADDLFLFVHGDVDSARVIMDTLVEFKEALVLTSSLPKSTAYFCNILNYTKLDILNILPFEEGKLSVKYLGIPLASSRLLYWDCKELMEKVKRQGEMKKCKGKVAWEKILQVRNIVCPFIWYRLRDGSKASAWFDKWCLLGPLVNIISNRDIYGAGYNRSAKLKHFMRILNIPSNLDAIVDFLLPLAKICSARSVISNLVFTASCYFFGKRGTACFYEDEEISRSGY
uniref:Putative reverse transcriptase domain, reverse transcriptase zinc-binding domain protein n=1 Tax=Tanacetum cinerariifolium TaxID=118510 RepID=A0A6L2L385_TANCI|nr:putative reverse transcriptase domain, reverse transcriptase zinc-binding domain protein [Tanacetum cinerariifolium]